MIPEVSVVIPHLPSRPMVTDLSQQTFKNFETIIIEDVEERGVAWARNCGAAKARGDFIFFLDDDILLEQDAMECLLKTLKKSPDKSYAYCSFIWDNRVYGNQVFDPELLKKKNYISANSLIRRVDFPGFDERLKRLVDWDLWLKLLFSNKYGVYCGKTLFRTQGKYVSQKYSWDEAVNFIKKKYGL